MYNRLIFNTILDRLKEPRQFIQVLIGPRQVGKTTLARQASEKLNFPVHFVSADVAGLKDSTWLQQQWDQARLLLAKNKEALLVIDEVQKIQAWSELIKLNWDADTQQQRPLKVLLLGSAPLLVQKGLTESLAGRFETLPVTHWSFTEMHDNFGFDLDHYIYFGGYPGAAELVDDQERWRRYIHDSLIETTLARDVLLLTRIDKPALLRQLFHLSCEYSGQILSYQKMVGQLQEAGNTTTLAHYLQLLSAVGMVGGLQKYANQSVRKRASSPKLQVFNTALMSSSNEYSFEQAKKDHMYWGRLVESCVGMHLLNQSLLERATIYYWRERNQEVDFVVSYKKELLAIEVKSHYKKITTHGLHAFQKEFPQAKVLQVGGSDGLTIENFLKTPLSALC